MMLVLGWTSCFVWMRLCWEGTVGAELKSQISGTEAPYCPRRTRAHRWWRVRTVKTALCPWALVLAPPIHHQPVVPTGLLTSYWPCSLIIRSAQNTLGRFSRPIRAHTNTLKLHAGLTTLFGPAASQQPYRQARSRTLSWFQWSFLLVVVFLQSDPPGAQHPPVSVLHRCWQAPWDGHCFPPYHADCQLMCRHKCSVATNELATSSHCQLLKTCQYKTEADFSSLHKDV